MAYEAQTGIGGGSTIVSMNYTYDYSSTASTSKTYTATVNESCYTSDNAGTITQLGYIQSTWTHDFTFNVYFSVYHNLLSLKVTVKKKTTKKSGSGDSYLNYYTNFFGKSVAKVECAVGTISGTNCTFVKSVTDYSCAIYDINADGKTEKTILTALITPTPSKTGVQFTVSIPIALKITAPTLKSFLPSSHLKYSTSKTSGNTETGSSTWKAVANVPAKKGFVYVYDGVVSGRSEYLKNGLELKYGGKTYGWVASGASFTIDNLASGTSNPLPTASYNHSKYANTTKTLSIYFNANGGESAPNAVSKTVKLNTSSIKCTGLKRIENNSIVQTYPYSGGSFTPNETLLSTSSSASTANRLEFTWEGDAYWPDAQGSLPSTSSMKRFGYTAQNVWAKNSPNGSQYSSNTSVDLDGSTYYAVWKPVDYKVTYVQGDATEKIELEGHSKVYGQNLNLRGKQDITRKGRYNAYTHSGWVSVDSNNKPLKGDYAWVMNNDADYASSSTIIRLAPKWSAKTKKIVLHYIDKNKSAKTQEVSFTYDDIISHGNVLRLDELWKSPGMPEDHGLLFWLRSDSTPEGYSSTSGVYPSEDDVPRSIFLSPNKMTDLAWRTDYVANSWDTTWHYYAYYVKSGKYIKIDDEWKTAVGCWVKEGNIWHDVKEVQSGKTVSGVFFKNNNVWKREI